MVQTSNFQGVRTTGPHVYVLTVYMYVFCVPCFPRLAMVFGYFFRVAMVFRCVEDPLA